MSVTSNQVKNLLTGGNQHFSQLGFGLMVTRLKGVYKANPSPATLQSCTQEINAFLTKFGMIMKDDAAILSRL